jgi:hypothetical protein
MVSSEMLRRVALVRTDVSDELSASIMVTRIGELGREDAILHSHRRENLKSYKRQGVSVSTSSTSLYFHCASAY